MKSKAYQKSANEKSDLHWKCSIVEVDGKKVFRGQLFDGTWNLFDSETNVPILKRKYLYLDDFSEGYARVLLENGFWNFIDINEKFLFSGKYSHLTNFKNGYALGKSVKTNRWNYYDKNERKLFESFDFDWASEKVGSLCVVCYDGDKFNYLTEDGKFYFQDHLLNATTFAELDSEHFISRFVKQDGEKFSLDQNGKIYETHDLLKIKSEILAEQIARMKLQNLLSS